MNASQAAMRGLRSEAPRDSVSAGSMVSRAKPSREAICAAAQRATVSQKRPARVDPYTSPTLIGDSVIFILHWIKSRTSSKLEVKGMVHGEQVFERRIATTADSPGAERRGSCDTQRSGSLDVAFLRNGRADKQLAQQREPAALCARGSTQSGRDQSGAEDGDSPCRDS